MKTNDKYYLSSVHGVCACLLCTFTRSARSQSAAGLAAIPDFTTAEGQNALFSLTTGVCEHGRWLVFAL